MKWNSVRWGMKYVVLGWLEQSMQDQNHLVPARRAQWNNQGRRIPYICTPLVGSLKMNTALEYSTRVVQEGDRRCEKSTLNDLAYLTPLRIPLMNPVVPLMNPVLESLFTTVSTFRGRHLSGLYGNGIPSLSLPPQDPRTCTSMPTKYDRKYRL